MNARIVNLRTRRKQKARDGKREVADKGPAPGVSKLERARAKIENRRARERLEGHRQEDERAGTRDGAGIDAAGDRGEDPGEDAG